MAKILNFEELLVWQKAQDVAVEIFKIFEDLRNYSFKDQIFRASISISNNIAEGFERGSDADFARFLRISKGSCSEVKSMIYLAFRLNIINQKQRDYLLLELTSINKMLNALIKVLKANTQKPIV